MPGGLGIGLPDPVDGGNSFPPATPLAASLRLEFLLKFLLDTCLSPDKIDATEIQYQQ
jgi:hypothetical protein